MKVNVGIVVGIVAVIGVVTLTGCSKKAKPQPSEPSGLLDRTGAALNDAGKSVGNALDNVGKNK